MEWELLDRFLEGKCSPVEAAQVEKWLAEFPARRELLRQIAEWGNAESIDAFAKAEEWARLEREMRRELEERSSDEDIDIR